MDWIEKAKQAGFDAAAHFDPSTLEAREDVREMCAVDKCRQYNRNWTCPPNCGTLEECQKEMHGYERGILLQTIGKLEKTFDVKGYEAAGLRHIESLKSFCEDMRASYPGALCLGAGGCTVCAKCSFPDPCVFPEKAMSSMEGYGLFIVPVCREAGLPYYYGKQTITYVGCILY